MKIKFVVMFVGIRGDREVKRYDNEGEAEKYIFDKYQSDIMGDVEYYIRKVWTTKR